jgi:hypothetical protein
VTDLRDFGTYMFLRQRFYREIVYLLGYTLVRVPAADARTAQATLEES